MGLLDEVLEAPTGGVRRAPGRRSPWPRRLRLLGPAALVAAVMFAGFATPGPTTSSVPDAAQAAVAWEDPCGLMSRPELTTLVGGTLGATDDYGDGAVSQCVYRGVPNAAVLFLDVQVVTEQSLQADDGAGPFASDESLPATLERLREESLSEPVALSGLGDEAWIVDDNIATLWVRQGQVLLGVVVAPRNSGDDVEAAQRVATLLLGVISRFDV